MNGLQSSVNNYLNYELILSVLRIHFGICDTNGISGMTQAHSRKMLSAEQATTDKPLVIFT
jgi:hypothetical protein